MTVPKYIFSRGDFQLPITRLFPASRTGEWTAVLDYRRDGKTIPDENRHAIYRGRPRTRGSFWRAKFVIRFSGERIYFLFVGDRRESVGNRLRHANTHSVRGLDPNTSGRISVMFVCTHTRMYTHM